MRFKDPTVCSKLISNLKTTEARRTSLILFTGSEITKQPLFWVCSHIFRYEKYSFTYMQNDSKNLVHTNISLFYFSTKSLIVIFISLMCLVIYEKLVRNKFRNIQWFLLLVKVLDEIKCQKNRFFNCPLLLPCSISDLLKPTQITYI